MSSLYSLPPLPASADDSLESLRTLIRDALKPSPIHPQFTAAQILLVAADVLTETAAGSAILEDLADRTSSTIATWATDWGLDAGVVDDDVSVWISNEFAVSLTTVVIN